MKKSGAVFIGWLFLATGPLQAADFSFEKKADRIVVRAGDELVTEYRFKERRPCLSPVIGPAGRHMARRWPLVADPAHPESQDHPHHSGLWFAHGDVRLEGDPSKADFWHKDRIVHQGFVDYEDHAAENTLVADNQWIRKDGKLLATDRSRIQFGQSEAGRWIDYTIQISAPEGQGLILGDTKEGTMALRVVEELAMETNDKKLRHLSVGKITNSEGVTGKAAWGKRAKWCAYHGDVAGKPALIAIFDHPENPRHPTWWMARHYGLFGANAFGKSYFEKAPRGSGDFRIPAGESVTFRYRFLFQSQAFEPSGVEAQYINFVEEDFSVVEEVDQEIPWTSIFNGRDFDAWVVPKDNIWWTAKDGVCTAQSGPKKKGSILWTQKAYSDFIVELDFRMGEEGVVDTGVFLRHQREQIQIGMSGSKKRDMTASPYIAGKGYPVEAYGVADVLKVHDWNTLRIQAEGSTYTVWLNGKLVMTYISDTAIEQGPIGLQLHHGRNMRVDFRNIRVAESDPAPTVRLDGSVLSQARKSAEIAGLSLSKVQRWLHEVALTKIDPKTKLYISHTKGSGRYREALWNYDDAAADTYPFLFWAAWYTDHDKINGPVLEVLEAEQRYGNHLDRIPTAVNHKTSEKVIKSKDDLIFAASEYVKDGLIAIVEVAGKNNPWFDRMRDIEDDIWKHADIDTPYGKIPTKNLEANGEQIQALVRLYTTTGEAKYLDWAERLADYYLLAGDFLPKRLRDHGCEIIGGLGLLLAVESEHRPEKAKVYLPHIRKMLDEILKQGTNEDGLMYNGFGGGGLSDGWGYNYVSYLCHDMVAEKPVYQEHLKRTLRNLSKSKYQNYNWEGKHSIDGYADSVEGALYLLNRLPIPEGLAWVDREVASNIVYANDKHKLWSTYKLESNGVRTALMHALMHTRGLIARPWVQNLELGAVESDEGLAIVLKSDQAYSGKLVFDRPRHRVEMGFKQDWPRMNTMPEWYTVEADQTVVVKDLTHGSEKTYSGKQLHEGLPISLQAGTELQLLVMP